MKIAFLLGSPDISGGTNVIFEHASRLQKFGHEVTILTESTVAAARYAWHPDASSLVWQTIENAANTLFDCILATWWQSVFFLARLRSRNFVYFVQSIESRFFPAQNQQISNLRDIDILAEWCENTYRYPLPIITEASWIQRYIFEHFHRRTELAVNGIRKDLFNTEGPAIAARELEKLRVLVEGPLGVFYKNVEKTISLCLQAEVGEIWLLTSTEITSFPGVDRCFSRIPIAQTAEIYRSCDVLVKLSSVEGMFGPPLEMFHCGGTAIVYDVTGHEEYIENGRNAIVVKKDDDHEVVSWLNRLKNDADFLEGLKKGALATAAGWPDWDQASRKFEESLVACSSGKDEISTTFLEEHNTHFLTLRENAFSARGMERFALRESAAISSPFVNFMQVYCDCGAGIMGELTDRFESGEWSICRVSQHNIGTSVRIRIDPSVRMGIVAVRSIRIIGEHSTAVIASWNDGDSWEDIDFAGTALCLRRRPYPVLETYGEDPQMVLPLLQLPEGEKSVFIEVELREMGFAQAFAQYSNMHEEKPKGVMALRSIFRYLRSLRSRYI